MIRIAYRSQAARPDLALISLAEIIAVSDRNNHRDQLTGALLVSQGRFFQILEGAEVDIDRTLARIQTDPRHHDIQLVLREAVSNRLFAGWAMVAARITPTSAPQIDAAIDQSSAEPQAAITAVVELVRRQQA